jgi:hypothetical protein
VAIVLIGAVALLSIEAIFFNIAIGKTVFFSIAAKETEIIHAVNQLEAVKIGLPYALEYSFYQAVYDVSKSGGYYSISADIPTYNSLPVWRKYDKTYEPGYVINIKQTTLNNLNKYVSQVKIVNIPQYTGVDILCGGGILYQYVFEKPEVCYYSLVTGHGVRDGDITWSEGSILERGQCVFANPDCWGLFGGVRSDTIRYHVGGCSDEYYFHGDHSGYEVSAAKVNNHAYLWASGEPKSDQSWALECCFSGTGTDGCNSDSADGQRFHANNVFTLANKNQIDKNGATEEDVVKKFNSAWCGNKDRNCLLCHADVDDTSKSKWYVCEGSPVPEGYGVVVVKAGEKIGSFECGYDGQWIQPTNIFCPVSTLTLKASSNGLISTDSNFYTAYDSPNTSQVVQSNLFNMFRIARERFIDEDTVKNTIANAISTNSFTCESDNSTVKSSVISSITSSFTEGDVTIEMRPAGVIIKPECNSTAAVVVEVKLTDKLNYPVYDGTTAYRNPQLRFYVITSNDYSFQPI